MSDANLQGKICALEQKRALIDALILFLKKHPDIAEATDLKQLSGRTCQVPNWNIFSGSLQPQDDEDET